MNDHKITHEVVSLQTIIEYYAKGFQAPPGEDIVDCFTVAIDPVKKVVVFSITTQPETPIKNHHEPQ